MATPVNILTDADIAKLDAQQRTSPKILTDNDIRTLDQGSQGETQIEPPKPSVLSTAINAALPWGNTPQAIKNAGVGMVRAVAEPVLKNVIARPLAGIEGLITKNEPVSFQYPFPKFLGGPIQVNPIKNIRQGIGAGIQTSALFTNPTAGGAMYMGGGSLENEESNFDVAKNAILGAILGKYTPLAVQKSGNVAEKVIGKAKGIFQPEPSVLMNKAQKITTEILQPPKGELASYIQRGKQMPAIEEATKAIKASNNYSELRNNIQTTIGTLFNKRNAILKENNFNVGESYLDELSELIKKTKKQGQATIPEIKAMQDVLAREKIFIQKNPNLNRLNAQARKETLQDLTHKLLEKRENGDIIDREPARNLALDALRRGLKRVVAGGDKTVESINSTYSGLKDAQWLISGQEALAQKAIPESPLQKTLSLFSKPKSIPLELSREALNRQNILFSKTKRIEGLVKKAGNQSLSR